MEKLLELPPLAIITFGAVLAVIFAVRYLGLWQGQSAPSKSSEAAAQVAAVIVDPSALNRGTAAVEALNVTLIERNMITREAAKVHAEDVRVMSEFTDEMAKLREEIRVSREINRK